MDTAAAMDDGRSLTYVSSSSGGCESTSPSASRRPMALPQPERRSARSSGTQVRRASRETLDPHLSRRGDRRHLDLRRRHARARGRAVRRTQRPDGPPCRPTALDLDNRAGSSRAPERRRPAARDRREDLRLQRRADAERYLRETTVSRARNGPLGRPRSTKHIKACVIDFWDFSARAASTNCASLPSRSSHRGRARRLERASRPCERRRGRRRPSPASSSFAPSTPGDVHVASITAPLVASSVSGDVELIGVQRLMSARRAVTCTPRTSAGCAPARSAATSPCVPRRTRSSSTARAAISTSRAPRGVTALRRAATSA